MIKILYLPLNVGGNVQQGMYDAFNSLEYVELKIFDFYGKFEKTMNASVVNQEFISLAREFQPDLIHMQLQMTNVIDSNTLRTVRNIINKPVIITNWSGDVRNNASKELLMVSKAVDYTLISSTGQIGLYQAEGCKNIKYWQIGYDPKIFYPLNKSEIKYDLIFCGNAYPSTTFADAGLRTSIITNLKMKLGDRFAVFGFGYPNNVSSGPLHGAAVNEAYNYSRCIFSMSNYNSIANYFSDRLLTCMAVGRPVISWSFPEYQTYFSDNQDILIANTVDGILDKLTYCIQNPDFADEVGFNGYLKMKSEHTYKSRVIELLNMLGLK